MLGFAVRNVDNDVDDSGTLEWAVIPRSFGSKERFHTVGNKTNCAIRQCFSTGETRPTGAT